MCGCEQGTCPGNCPCGCKHTWPPTHEEVMQIVNREIARGDQYRDRVIELRKELGQS